MDLGDHLRTLEGMMQLRKWPVALEVAEEILPRPDLGREERAGVLRSLCECRTRTGDPGSGIQPGHDAVFLARDTQQWDLLGDALFWLADCYYSKGLYKEAARQYQEFLTHLDHYRSASEHECVCRYNLAVSLRGQELYSEAAEVLDDLLARAAGKVSAEDYSRYRHTLIHYYLKTEQTEPVPALLIACEDYCSAHPEDILAAVNLTNDRAHYAYVRKDYATASKLAKESAERDDAPHELRAEAYLHLQQIALDLDMPQHAFAMGVLAQQQADLARREDLRREAIAGCEQAQLLDPRAVQEFMKTIVNGEGGCPNEAVVGRCPAGSRSNHSDRKHSSRRR